jgi:predicted N-acyltransferase
VPQLKFRILGSMKQVPAAAWDALEPRSLFTSHAWLSALEDSRLVAPGTAIEYRIHVLESESGEIVAAAPGVLKRLPLAEYGAEMLWQRAAEARGIRLLPKISLEVPLTPVRTPKLRVRPGWPRAELSRLLLKAAVEAASRSSNVASFSIGRMAESDEAAAQAHGFVTSPELGSRWVNRGWRSHEEFLGGLRSDYRNALKRERRRFAGLGVELRLLRGSQVLPSHWAAFMEGHAAICRGKQAPVLLNEDFLGRVSSSLGDAICLQGVFAGERYLSGAFMVIDGDTLYSRSWSEVEFAPGAVFEASLHRPIEIAIELGLNAVDGGTLARHKPKRGYAAFELPSAHWFRDPAMEKLARNVATRARSSIAVHLVPSWESRYMHGPSPSSAAAAAPQ